MPRRVLIAAPTVEAVTLAELKTMLGIASDGSDELLEAMRDAVAGTLDPASGGWLGRALRPQTWELRLAAFPSGEIKLPYPPVTEVTSVKYDDSAGVEKTLVKDTDYRIFGLDDFHGTRIAPVYNGSWPSARYDTEAVRIRFKSGYATGTPDTLPGAIKAAIALGVQQLRATGERSLYLSAEEIPGVRARRWVVSESAAKVIERAIGNLLASFRVYG